MTDLVASRRPFVAGEFVSGAGAPLAVESPATGEVIAEVNVHRTLTELTRFRVLSRITREVAEQMCVDAIEHVFACNAR